MFYCEDKKTELPHRIKKTRFFVETLAKFYLPVLGFALGKSLSREKGFSKFKHLLKNPNEPNLYVADEKSVLTYADKDDDTFGSSS